MFLYYAQTNVCTLKKVYVFIMYLFERERDGEYVREHKQSGGVEGEGEPGSQTGCWIPAPRDPVLSLRYMLNWLSYPCAPFIHIQE